MAKNKIINVQGLEITIITGGQEDYISLTDIAKHKNNETGLVIAHWLSTKFTIEFMGLWEQMNNPGFNVTEFSNIKNEAGSNGFILSSKQWIEKTAAIGIISKTGRYGGGTFAHKDIAFEFASWISAAFKLYFIKEFQRLKDEENDRLKLNWNLQRTLAKVNYHIHTEAIKENLIPKELDKNQVNFVYANEADLLNVALFGITAKQWRDANPVADGNLRDEATIEQLVVLSNLESINAVLIHQGKGQPERLQQLNTIAISQMRSLINSKQIKKLK
jgi:hypothetical protein